MTINKVHDKFMAKSQDLLDDLPELVSRLTSKYTRQEILNKGIDKNLLYRLQTNQNITTRNLLKIKTCFPEIFSAKSELDGVSDLPIIGQIVNHWKVRPMPPTLNNYVKVPTGMIEYWSPIFAYHNEVNDTFDKLVFIFSSKNIDSTHINHECIKRHIIAFPENEQAMFGYLEKKQDTSGEYRLIHPVTRATTLVIPKDNNINWAYMVHAQSYTLCDMLLKSEETRQESSSVQQRVHKLLINKSNK